MQRHLREKLSGFLESEKRRSSTVSFSMKTSHENLTYQEHHGGMANLNDYIKVSSHMKIFGLCFGIKYLIK